MFLCNIIRSNRIIQKYMWKHWHLNIRRLYKLPENLTQKMKEKHQRILESTESFRLKHFFYFPLYITNPLFTRWSTAQHKHRSSWTWALLSWFCFGVTVWLNARAKLRCFEVESRCEFTGVPVEVNPLFHFLDNRRIDVIGLHWWNPRKTNPTSQPISPQTNVMWLVCLRL